MYGASKSVASFDFHEKSKVYYKELAARGRLDTFLDSAHQYTLHQSNNQLGLK